MFNIEEELKKLPSSPGVYLMHDGRDTIIYVGKAINLKNRVRQYFQKSRNVSSKIEQMVTRITYFEYIVTDSELEALILESNLIKEHQPRYNTMLKDDKSYPYIKVTVQEDYPRILFSRDQKKDKSKYFGPFTSAGAVKDTIELLTKIYKIRTCSRVLPRDIGKERPCLNYHIQQCDGPCQGYISKRDYGQAVQSTMEFLKGNFKDVLNLLEDKMNQASEELEFEKAIEYRELLFSVRQIFQKQKMEADNNENKDIIAYAADGLDAVVQVFFIRNGKLLGREHFHLRIALQESGRQILGSFIKQYYAGTPFIPKELLVQEEPEDEEVIEEWLSGRLGQKVRITTPKKGGKEKLVELAKKNADLIISQDKEKLRIEHIRTAGAMEEIRELLGLEKLNRIEAFDISNTSGYESVASMVVYEGGKPKRNDYRKFRIKWVKGADDYSSLAEVLTRRLAHGIKEAQELEEKGISQNLGNFTKFPDLILMDGGKGQVNIALRVLEEMGLDIPVCGMVKDDNHRTRGLYYRNEEVPLKKSSEGFRLITRIQDETHRFAIEYHRKLRGKEQLHSILDDIEGVGPKRRLELMKAFKNIDNIKNADMEELNAVPGMNMAAARKIYEFFH
ncbi:excinuclease ABC subunit UvrC [Parasporobacterium paucivorans]|nr:excinuclease ABC subunit UvrC [Parasporobacterium paucivorans]